MTVRELRAGIRRLTEIVNVKIAEIRGTNKADELFEKEVSRLERFSAYITKKGEMRVPHSKEGLLGLGYSGKSKSALERQYAELETFNEREWYSSTAMKQRNEKAERAYNTFTKRYGDLTFDEWEDFTHIMNGLKNYIRDYGYEDIGNSLAEHYASSNQKGRFYDQVMNTVHNMKGRGVTPEDFVDALNDLMVEEGAIDEW